MGVALLKRYSKIIWLGLILSSCIFIAGCAKSNMTLSEKALLTQPYNKLTIDDEIAFSDLTGRKDLTEDDINKITSYINGNISDDGLRKYFIDKLNGKEAPKEQEPSDQSNSSDAYSSTVAEISKYSEAKDKIQAYISANIIKDDKVKQYVSSITAEEDAANKKIKISVDTFRPYLKSLTVGDIVRLRNNLVDTVQKNIDVETVEVNFVYGSSNLDSYIFTKSNGWDKEVTPWKN